MSMSDAIVSAVNRQLANDGKQPKPPIGDEIMGTTFKYTAVTILGFLQGVAEILQTGVPPYVFAWQNLDCNQAIADSVTELCGDIEQETT